MSNSYKYNKKFIKYMEGLPKGDNVVFLELKDKENKVVPGDYNSTRRRFTIE